MNPNIDQLLSRLSGVRKQGNQWMALCPAHQDSTPSLSIAISDTGNILLCCHAGCETANVTAAIGYTLADLCNGKPNGHAKTNGHASPAPEPVRITCAPGSAAPTPVLTHPQLGKPSMLHIYQTVDKQLLGYVMRFDLPSGKEFRPYTYSTADGWQFKKFSTPRPLYGLERLRKIPGGARILCEGEKAADAAQRLAPSNACLSWCGGAGSVKYADLSQLAGQEAIIWPDADGLGRKAGAELAELLHAIGCKIRVVDTSGLPDGFDAADLTEPLKTWLPPRLRSYVPVAPAPLPKDDAVSVKLFCAAGVVCVPIRWLWREWIARGKLHILAGAPGTGKTTVALAIVAVVTTGGYFPDGTRAPLGNVLIWSGEDDWADTLAPRLKAAGADLSRVFFVGDTTGDDEPRPFDPARDLAALEAAAAQIGDVALLIADPVVSAVSGDSHKNTEVRRALQPIVHLAQRLDCAVLGISHFSKNTAGREPLERVTGSVAFGALARVVLVAAKGAEGEPRLFARAKSNIGPDGGGFAYELKQVMHDGIETCTVAWGETLEGTARDLLGDTEIVGDSPRDDASTWLIDLLSNGPLPVKFIKSEATAAGVSWRTVERAKTDLEVIAERISSGKNGVGHWEWRLSNTANLHRKSGGLAESKAPQGFEGCQEVQDRHLHGDDIAGGVAATETFDI